MPAALFRTMADGLSAIGVLRRSGAIELRDPVELLRTARDATVLGPVATAFAHAARHNGAATAIVDEQGPLTFAELDRRSNAVANGLVARGITSATVLATLCRDHRGMVLSLLAAGKLGARIVLLNTGMAGPQLVSVAERENVGAILLDSEFLHRFGDLPNKLPMILTSDDGWANHEQPTLDDVRAGQPTRPLASPEQPGGIVVLTSGTTGTPKGAPRGKVSPLQSAQFLDRIPLPKASATVLAAPAFHGTGLSQLILGWALGSTIILQQRKFDPRRTLADVEHHRAGTLVLVPTMLQRIVDLGESVLAEYDTSSLKVIFAAGSGYDEDRRRITEPGVVGTIFVASALSFGGYTDGTGKETVDGMQSSGDVGHLDAAGRLFIDGRDDDMIVSGGENVFPLEVENLLVERPDILEAAVVGVDDRDFGKRLRAFVVPAPGASCDAQQIKDYVKATLARHKVPRDVVFVDELPRNATGKLLRRKLESADPQ
ncbi:AMP-binding protein [Nocardia fluminea]|uniref:AMP-binding protein n=1 Tax=Nocardia fluminea TaxID=134984 RepID=UPI003D1354F0